MNLTTRQLKIFVSLAHTLSFSRTADFFHLTQPRLSAIVATIEDEVGVKLFDRTTRSVRVTPEGQALLPAAMRLVDEFDGGMARLAAIARQHTRSLSIAALPTYVAALLSGLVDSLQRREPDASIEVHDVLSDEAIDMLRLKKVDLAITSLDACPADLVCEEVVREHFVLVGTRAMLATAGLKTPLKWSESSINEMSVIALAPGSSAFDHIDRAFRASNLQFRPKISLRNLIAIRGFVKTGLGIGLLPELSALLLDDPDLIRVKFVDGPVRSIGVIYRRNEALPPLSQTFVDDLKKWRSDVVKRSERKVPDILDLCPPECGEQRRAESFGK